MIGRTLGHYRVIEKLGEGGMGVVYCAKDEELPREVALKLLSADLLNDPVARARLLREARAAASLNHPNICKVYEVDEADGQAFIAMELVGGRTLSSVVESGPLSPKQVVRYGLQVSLSLIHI